MGIRFVYRYRYNIIHFMITFFLEEIHSGNFHQNAVKVFHVIVHKLIQHIKYVNQAH